MVVEQRRLRIAGSLTPLGRLSFLNRPDATHFQRPNLHQRRVAHITKAYDHMFKKSRLVKSLDDDDNEQANIDARRQHYLISALASCPKESSPTKAVMEIGMHAKPYSRHKGKAKLLINDLIGGPGPSQTS